MIHASNLKHDLSENTESTVDMYYDDRQLNLTVSRDFFEEQIEPFIDRTLTTCEDVLFAARKSWDEVDTVLLCGGSSQIPLVRRKLKELTGIEPTLIDNPQELVAKGCALYAATLSENPQLNFKVANVNSHSLGIRGRDVETGRPTNRILVPRNSTLPRTVIKKFVTSKDHQEHVFVVLLEGESENPNLCFEAGKFKIGLGRGVRKGDVIEVHCRYDEDGRISVFAKSPNNPALGRLEIKSSHRRLESLDVWKNRIIYGVDFEVDEDSFEGVDLFSEDVPYGYDEVKDLDEVFRVAGESALTAQLPHDLLPQQNFVKKLFREIEILEFMIEKGEERSERQREARKANKIRRRVYELKLLRSQRRRALNYAVIGLGRACFLSSVDERVVDVPVARIQELRTKLAQIWV